MTATQPARTPARYRGAVYGIDILDHETGQVVPNDYVGKTRQKGRARENQHRDTQPFSDRIVGSPRVLWEGICTEDELDEMERHFIQDVPVRPRMNWLMNEDNPHHIPKWVQIEQRHARDDAAGVPRWQPPEQRQRSSLLEWETATPIGVSRRVAPVRKWRPWQKRLVGWSSAWLALVGAAFFLLAQFGPFAEVEDDLIAALVSGSALIVWVMCGAPIPVGRSQRRARKLRRWLW